MQLRATRAGSIGNRRPAALTLSQLLPSGAGRVAAIYSDPAKPSYDECIAKNVAAIAAGRPQDCVLFSDAAGQTPVVYPIGAGQGKGLLLDRSAGLVRGAELVVNGTFAASLTGWAAAGGATLGISSGAATVTGAINARIEQTITLSPGVLYEVSATVSASAGSTARLVYSRGAAGGYVQITSVERASGAISFFVFAPASDAIIQVRVATADGTVSCDNISVRELPGHHQQQPTAAARGEFSRRYNQLLATATLATQSITAIAAQYRLYFTGAGTVTLSGAATGAYSAGSHTITCTAGSLTLTPAGSVLTADLRLEADATIGLPAYQRVTTASDYDETGFPTYWRAQTDDWAKSRMNPNGATKVYAIWTGQKMLESISGILVETSANSDGALGAMRLVAPSTAGAFSASFGIKGAASTVTAYTDPVTQLQTPKRLVLQGYASVLEDVVQLKANSTTVAVSTDLGAVSCTEQDVFFGARAGTSLFANFREYAPPLILFLQPADSLSASHLAKLQKGYAKAVGVTL